MPDAETIAAQEALLYQHRRRLAVLLVQQARFGDHTPPHIRLDIEDAQRDIQKIKAQLRAWGVEVEDLPGDTAATRLDGAPPTTTIVPRKDPALAWWVVRLLVVLVIVIVGWYWLSARKPTVQQCDTIISFGELIECRIDTNTEIDSYTFTTEQHDRILISVVRALEITPDGLGPSFEVVQEGGAGIQDCAARDVWHAETVCTMPLAGTYTLLVADGQRGATGVYRLYIQRLNNPGKATPINIGVPIIGSIDKVGQFNTYTFTAAANTRIDIEIVRNDATGAKIGPWFEVYPSDSNQASVCKGSNAFLAEAECTISATGTYTLIVADGFREEKGSYTVILKQDAQ